MVTQDQTDSGTWPPTAQRAKLHFVSGKGGTGKTTIAGALALALARGGRKVLLVETEGRQGIAQLFDRPPLPPVDELIHTSEGGGEVWGLAIDIEYALMEYLDMFYKLGFAGRAIKKVGAIDFVTTVAPGLRDVLITGKIKERVIALTDDKRRLRYDAVVVDSPPTGRIGNFLDVTSAMRDLAQSGPIRSQSEGVVTLLHSPQTAVHLCTLLEAMPIQETIDAVSELTGKGLGVGVIFVNRVNPLYLPEADLDEIAEGRIDVDRIRDNLAKVGLAVTDGDFAGLLTETIDYATRKQAQQVARAQLDEADAPQLELPSLEGVMDTGALYELANILEERGV